MNADCFNLHTHATRSKSKGTPAAITSIANEYSPTDLTPTKAINEIPKKKRDDLARLPPGPWRRKIYA